MMQLLRVPLIIGRTLSLVLAAFVFWLAASVLAHAQIIPDPTFTKSFSGPVLPGATVDLTFRIENNSSDYFFSATFTDDLDAMLTGAEAVGLSGAEACGFGSSLNGTSVITLLSAEILQDSFCEFTVTVQVPNSATPGTYPNETSTLDVLWSFEGEDSYPPATDDLIVDSPAAPEINVVGNGNDIVDGDISPRSADHTSFGSTNVDGGTLTRTFTVENQGTSDLTLGANAVSLSGAHASDFSVTSQPTSTVSPNLPTTFTIEFDPSATGTRSATVTIANDDADESPYSFAIEGEGASSPEINVTGNSNDIADGDTSPRSADHTSFGSAEVDGGVLTRTFTVENEGTAVLTLGANAVTLSGAHASDFSVTLQPATSLNPSGSSNFTIEFDPSATGTRSATVTIANDDADESPYSFAIEGEGEEPAVGSVTIVQSITGDDRTIAYASSAPDFNFMLISVDGDAQTSISNLAPGTYAVRSEDLSQEGYALLAVACDDDDSIGEADNRRATISVAANEHVTCIFEFIQTNKVTQIQIRTFLSTRNGLLLKYLPDIGRRLDRLNQEANAQSVLSAFGFAGPSPLPVDIEISQNVFNYAASSRGILNANGVSDPELARWDVWSEGHVAWVDDGAGGTGVAGFLYSGVDYLVTEDILLGLQLELDWASQNFAATGGNVEGTGWMVGPYGLIRVGEDIYFDFGALWGRSTNQISPFGTYSDRFDTTRWIVYGSVVGEFEVDNWIIRPTGSLKLIEDYQHAYVDSLGVPISGQSVSQAEIAFSPRISYVETLEDGTEVIPWAELSTVYVFHHNGLFGTSSVAPALDGFSGTVEVGVDVSLPGGAFAMVSGQIDGLGSTAHSLGLTAGISAPIN